MVITGNSATSKDIKEKVNNNDINVRFLVSYGPQREMVVVKGQERMTLTKESKSLTLFQIRILQSVFQQVRCIVRSGDNWWLMGTHSHSFLLSVNIPCDCLCERPLSFPWVFEYLPISFDDPTMYIKLSKNNLRPGIWERGTNIRVTMIAISPWISVLFDFELPQRGGE